MAKKIYADRVTIDRQGYDKRGRYWGVGQKLYYVSDEDGGIDKYVRADSASEAKRKAQ